MKKTFKFFAAALAIVAAASCAKEINVDTPADTPVDDSAEKVQMTFTASYDAEGETKTVLAENNFIHWTDDDAIRIISKDKYGDWYINDEVFVIDPSSNDDDPTFADFSGNIVPSTNYYAAYPASGWSTYNSASKYIQFDGLANQTAVKGAFDPSKHLALAVSLKENHFYFQNVCSLVKVTIGSDDIYSIQLSGSASTSSYGSANLGGKILYKAGQLTPYQIYTNAGTEKITLKNSNPNEQLAKGYSYYIVVPECNVKNFTITLYNKNGEVVGSKAKSKDFQIQRNKIYDLGTFTASAPVVKYKIKTPTQPLTFASDLTTGKMYMIFFSKKSDHTKEDSYCWKVNTSDGKVIKQSVTDKSAQFDETYVFAFNEVKTLSKYDNYTSYKHGILSAVGRDNLYFKNLAFTENYSSYATYMIFANHWGDESKSRCDIDIWREDNGKTLWDYSGNLAWGTNADSPRKFFIYEVEKAK